MIAPARSLGLAIGLVACAAAALAPACARTLDEIGSFPCARDGTCPDGFTCLAGIGCKSGRPVDAPCGTGDRCAAGDCVGQRCLPRCSDERGCEPGRVCSYPSVPGAAQGGWCLVDCESAPCPGGLECQVLFGTKRGCVAPAAKVAFDKLCERPEDCQVRYGATPLPITCARGSCALFCALPIAPCGDPTRVCHVGDPLIRSGCVVDCGAGTPCPQGLECKTSPNTCGSPASP